MTTPTSPNAVCPTCSTPGTGRYCANCGSSLEGATCPGCRAPLTPGAKFCHKCGIATGAPAANAANAGRVSAPSGGIAGSLPWIVAAIALVVLLAFLGGNRFNASRGSTLDAPQNALPQAGLDDRGVATAPGMPGAAPVRGPDISQLSPQERAERLFNRVMSLNSQGKSDSVQFFAPMALEAYRLLTPIDADQRYDMGRIAEVAGALPLAGAQADTILQQNSTHLLGLILGARIATLTSNSTARKSYETRLLAAFAAESAKRLPEYLRHEDDITNAVATARAAAGATR